MIRRDFLFADGQPGWGLVSQVEHARISGELAAACDPELILREAGTIPLPKDLAAHHAEVVAAIFHHDDGWSEWERSPQVDGAERPLSYTELAPADAVEIWTRSVAAAERIGPLSAWMVAGHFLRLLKHSDGSKVDPVAWQWRDAMNQRRIAWLSEWQSNGDAWRSTEVAERAREWLWTFDELSLWLCCDRPPGTDEPAPRPFAFCAGHGTALQVQLTATAGQDRSANEDGATVEPWNFVVPRLDFTIVGRAIPREDVQRRAELWSNSTPFSLQRELRPA